MIIGLLVSQDILAIAHLRLSIDQLLFNNMTDRSETRSLSQSLQLDQVEVELDISSIPARLSINLSKTKFPPPYNHLKYLKLHCGSFSLDNMLFSCHKGKISVNGLFSKQAKSSTILSSAVFSLDYHLLNHQVLLSIEQLNTKDTAENKNVSKKNNSLSLQFQIKDNQWTANVQAQQIHYQQIERYIKFYLAETFGNIDETFDDIGGQGTFSAKFSGAVPIDGLENKPQSADFTLKKANITGSFNKIHYAYQDNLAENLAFQYHIAYKAEFSSSSASTKLMASGYKAELSSPSASTKLMASGYRQDSLVNEYIDFKLNNAKGEIYQNQIYLVFQGNERLASRIQFGHKDKQILFSKFHLKLPDIAEINARGEMNSNTNPNSGITDHFKSLNADIKLVNASQLNSFYFKNILSGTDYEGLDMSGKSNFMINLDSTKIDQSIDIKLNLSDFYVSFNNEITFDKLNASIHWQNDYLQKTNQNQKLNSYLSWQKASLNQLPLGQASIDFMSYGDQFRLLKKINIPLFDGALQIDNLDIQHIAQSTDSGDNTRLTVNGMIKPVSLSLISEHFDWPVMDGKLSAMIPQTTYHQNHFEIGGAMLLQVFDGDIIIKDLSIEEPLQDYARLKANIDLNNLNLKSLTKTYDFGEIQGRLEGKISDLVLQSWQPVAFNASLQTPDNDKSQHKISQRAIDNLSSLGGVSGLLSRSFLSFFENFGYHKIGLSCKLKNNICFMAGVEKKGNGYYIVKGGGIPRIDVMGFQDKVNWQVLISRLTTIRNANQAVIQ